MLPASGPIKLSQCFTEFNRPAQSSMSSLYGAGEQLPVSGTLKLSDFYGKAVTLPPIISYVFHNQGDAATFSEGYSPPTSLQIFNTWGRFSYNAWYPPGTPPAGEATSWQFNNTTNAIESNINSTTIIGFVSDEQLSNYTLEVTLSSTSADDDVIGVVIAFFNDGTNNHYLMAARNQSNAGSSWLLQVYTGSTPSVILNNTAAVPTVFTNPGQQGWLASGSTKIKVVRTGNTIQCWTSNFGSSELVPASLMTYDLSSNTKTQKLVGAKSYGFFCSSQAYSTFKDLSVRGGFDTSLVYDLYAGRKYVYEVASDSFINIAADVVAELGYPRQVTNPATNQSYFFHLDKSVTVL